MGCHSNLMNLSDRIQRMEYFTARVLTFSLDSQRFWLCCLSINSIRTFAKFHVGGFNYHIRPNAIPYTLSMAQKKKTGRGLLVATLTLTASSITHTLRNLHVQQQRSKGSFGDMHKDVEETPPLVLLVQTASSEKLAVSDC